MSKQPLAQRARDLFAQCVALCAGRPALAALRDELIQADARLDLPMRVAIVGKIKAGKSTFMNAVLGAPVVPTGAVETTFNVNWLVYGATPALRVAYKDGRPPTDHPFAELEQLTRRAETGAAELLEIAYVQVAHPSPILRTFQLIDTPGLASVYQDDSQNTLDFLRLHGDGLSAATEAQARNADAVLYLFSQGVAEGDAAILAAFQGALAGVASPLNAIGVLTKVDDYGAEGQTPIERGRQIAAGLLHKHGRLRQLLYAICPLSGLLALGAQTLDAEQRRTLCELALLPRTPQLLASAHRFAEREYPDVPVSPARRRQLLDSLGLYGVSLAVDWLAALPVERSAEALFAASADLPAQLLAQSGLPELLELVGAHFGRRATLIKLSGGLQRVKIAAFQAGQRLLGGDLAVARQVGGAVEAMLMEEHAFAELRVLEAFYQGRLQLDDEETAEMLRVVGEYGLGPAARLGLPEDAPPELLRSTATRLLRGWRLRATDPFGSDPRTQEATRLIARSCELLVHLLANEVSHPA